MRTHTNVSFVLPIVGVIQNLALSSRHFPYGSSSHCAHEEKYFSNSRIAAVSKSMFTFLDPRRLAGRRVNRDTFRWIGTRAESNFEIERASTPSASSSHILPYLISASESVADFCSRFSSEKTDDSMAVVFPILHSHTRYKENLDRMKYVDISYYFYSLLARNTVH